MSSNKLDGYFINDGSKNLTDSFPVKLYVLTVNYCSSALVCQSLGTLIASIAPTDRVLIIDNASSDNSFKVIDDFLESKGFRDICCVVASNINGGFSYGNNRGIDIALSSGRAPEYLLLLNPDALVQENSVQALVSFMDQHPQVGIAGSRLENANGEQEASAHIFPSPLGELEAGARLGILSRLLERYVVTPPQPESAAQCDWVSGASMIIRREVIKTIGLMDEGFFLYFEEVDYCKRAKEAGWECWYVPESKVMHLEGASTGIKVKNKRRPKYWYDSRRRFFVKHYGVLGLFLADCLFAVGRVSYLLRRVLRLGAQGENHDPKYFMFDLLWGDLFSFLKGDVFRIRRITNECQ